MSYDQLAKIEVLSAISGLKTETELAEFKDFIAHYFAAKAQKEIDALYDNGTITDATIEAWGHEHMRTPYRHAVHRA